MSAQRAGVGRALGVRKAVRELSALLCELRFLSKHSVEPQSEDGFPSLRLVLQALLLTAFASTHLFQDIRKTVVVF